MSAYRLLLGIPDPSHYVSVPQSRGAGARVVFEPEVNANTRFGQMRHVPFYNEIASLTLGRTLDTNETGRDEVLVEARVSDVSTREKMGGTLYKRPPSLQRCVTMNVILDTMRQTLGSLGMPPLSDRVHAFPIDPQGCMLTGSSCVRYQSKCNARVSPIARRYFGDEGYMTLDRRSSVTSAPRYGRTYSKHVAILKRIYPANPQP